MRQRRRTRFDAVNEGFLVLFVFTTLYPFVWVVAASFSDPAAVARGEVVLWPLGFNLRSYELIVNYAAFWTSYANTVFYVVAGSLLNVSLTMLAAYPLSRTWLQGRTVITFFIVFTLFFSGGLIPTYLLVRDLGLLDTRWAMLLPSAVNAFNLIIARTYLQANIPDELVEAAAIDGATELRILVQVVLPLSTPVLAVITLFYAVEHWNAFFHALIFLRDRGLMPLQVILREILIVSNVEGALIDVVNQRANLTVTIRYSAIVIATVPILLVYPFLQRYFVRGLLIGSLKG